MFSAVINLEMEKLEGLHKGASFVKILGLNFSHQLQIPQDFTKTINHRIFIESSMTKKCWRVEVEKDEDGMTYLREGWTAFADAHGLKFGYVLLFQYEEQSIFHVTIYDQNGCQKNMFFDSKECHPNSPKLANVIEEENKGEEEEEGVEVDLKLLREERLQKRRRLSSTEKYNTVINKNKQAVSETHWRSTTRVGENNTSFSITMAKKYQFAQQFIPWAVVREMKLTRKNEVVLKLNDVNWSVKLAHKTNGDACFSGGWKYFLKENKVVYGDTLSFKFDSDNIAQVHVTRHSESPNHLNYNEVEKDGKDAESFPVDDKHGALDGDCATEDDQIVEMLDFPMEDDLIGLIDKHGALDGPPGFPLMTQHIL